MRFPPFWALWAALALNLGGAPLPEGVADLLAGIGRGLLFLVPLALGIYVRLPRSGLRVLATGLALRVPLGLVLAAAVTALLPLGPAERSAVLFAAAAPVGFNSLVFAVREDLDRELAAGLASLSVIAGLVYLPLLAPALAQISHG